MTEKEKKNISKFISKILRHRPEIIGIRLDEHGWADVDELVAGVRRAGHPGFDREMLDEIVETNNKKRYSYSVDGRLIRANQGHSIPVDVELPKMTPPDVLWHGTGECFLPSIQEQGILRMGRLYVHLSLDEATAEQVGRRHGKPKGAGGVFFVTKHSCTIFEVLSRKPVTAKTRLKRRVFCALFAQNPS